jgi:hypothetical protein
MKVNKFKVEAMRNLIDLRTEKLTAGTKLYFTRLVEVIDTSKPKVKYADYFEGCTEDGKLYKIRLSDILQFMSGENGEALYRIEGNDVDFGNGLQVISSDVMYTRNRTPIYADHCYKRFKEYLNGTLTKADLFETQLRDDVTASPRQRYIMVSI